MSGRKLFTRLEEASTEGIEHLGNPRFLELLEQIRATHIAKAAGYAGSDNPDTWSNFREAKSWGSTPLQGCFIRMGDKYRRIQNLVRNPDNDRVGEPIKVTLLDLANYCIIAVCLLEEEEKVPEVEPEWPKWLTSMTYNEKMAFVEAFAEEAQHTFLPLIPSNKEVNWQHLVAKALNRVVDENLVP